MTHRPFISLLLVAGLGLLLICVLTLLGLPHPLTVALHRCTATPGLCQHLVQLGHQVGGPALLALLPWSLWRGVRSGWRQYLDTRRALARLQEYGTSQASGQLAILCAELGLGNKVTLVATEMPLAFCHGLLWPRIWLSTGTTALLARAELAAVLRHEHAHARGHHPLQLLVARSVADAFAFLPVLRELANALPRHQELVADRAVIRAGERHALGQALLAMTTAADAASPLTLASGMAGALEARINQLTGLDTPPTPLSREALQQTWLALGAGLLLIRVSTLGLPRETLFSLPTLPPPSVTLDWRCLFVPMILLGAPPRLLPAIKLITRRYSVRQTA
jgi:Zn-dependent protease with chaperone function